MQVPSTSHVGKALLYLVTLTNDKNQPTDFTSQCPNYEEELFADIVHGSPPLGGKHIYALNCGEAGPIQPGASVTFQMVFLVPVGAAPGKYTLTFGLGYLNAMTSFAQAVVTLSGIRSRLGANCAQVAPPHRIRTPAPLLPTPLPHPLLLR